MHVVLLPSFYPTPSNPLAGSFFREQARALKDAGLRVGVVAVPEKAPWQPPRAPGAWPRGMIWEDDDGVPTLRGYRRRLRPGYHWPRLRAWAEWGSEVFEHYVERCGRPDVLHAHVADPAGLLGARIKARNGIPMVLTEHASWLARGTGGRIRDEVARIAIDASDAGIVVSPALGERLSARLPRPKGGWRWVPNMVGRQFLEAPLSAPHPPEGIDYCVLSVGWLTPLKGHGLLLKAFAEAFPGDDSVALRIGGSGPREGRLRGLAKRLGIGHRVHFLGRLSRDEVLREVGKANVFVLPSYFETFGVVLLEALAMGRPVVATACGGPESFIRDSEGILVPPGDVHEMAKAIRKMRAGAGGFDARLLREDTRLRFGPAAVCTQVRSVYSEVLPL